MDQTKLDEIFNQEKETIEALCKKIGTRKDFIMGFTPVNAASVIEAHNISYKSKNLSPMLDKIPTVVDFIR